MLTLSEAWLSNVVAEGVFIFNDMLTIMTVAIGIPLGFYLVRKVIALVRMR